MDVLIQFRLHRIDSSWKLPCFGLPSTESQEYISMHVITIRTTILKYFFLVSIILPLAACDGDMPWDDEDDEPQLSGTVTTNNGHYADSDVNNRDASFASNDTSNDAQGVANGAVVGGYVNMPGAGPAGRSQVSGDTVDYYSVPLLGGQYVNLYLGDGNGTIPGVQLDLLQGDTVEANSAGSSGALSVQAPRGGSYYVRITITQGAVSYVMGVGEAGVATTAVNSFSSDGDFVPGQLIVRFKDSVVGAQSAQMKAANLGMQVKGGDMSRSMLLSLDSSATVKTSRLNVQNMPNQPRASNAVEQLKQDTVRAAAALQRRADVESVRLNYYVYPLLEPNDQHYSLQWHYPLINLPQAWDITTGVPAAGDPDVIVAVIDTGLVANHPDLDYANQFVYGYDFISSTDISGDGDGLDPDPTDPGPVYHGTHVAGTIAANTHNGIGVAGVSWGAKVMPLRALGDGGQGTDYDVAQAILYAARLPNDSGRLPARKADVINLSLGRLARDGETRTPPAAYTNAWNQGVIIIAAAGNDTSGDLNLPSGYTGVVSVSAVSRNRQIASYSNFGVDIDLTAPGGDFQDFDFDGYSDWVIISTQPFVDGEGIFRLGYVGSIGTSMAAPHVAGVVALMKSVNPSMTPDQFDNMLASGSLTEDIGVPGRDNLYGYGLVDAYKAVVAVSNPPVIINATPQLNPSVLNFGLALSTMTFNASKSGTGNLAATPGTPSESWLSVSASNVDVDGLGVYSVTINRFGLADGLYNAIIPMIYSGPGTTETTVNVSVAMQVATNASQQSAGPQTVQLRNISTNATISQTVTSSTGQYNFRIVGVPAGSYVLSSGSDLDNDGITDERGESGGDYSSGAVIVNGDSSIGNLDFEAGFSQTQ